MNNKGFTLVEILAAIVILGLVMSIAAVGTTNVINNSKKKSEEIFIGKFKNAVIEYLDLYGMDIAVSQNDRYKFNKCIKNGCYNEGTGNYVPDTFYEVSVDVLNNLSVRELIDKNILAKSSIVNPANKKECFGSTYPNIRVFRDDDFVYYFYVDLSGSNTTCEISGENAIISTLPKALADKVGL